MRRPKFIFSTYFNLYVRNVGFIFFVAAGGDDLFELHVVLLRAEKGFAVLEREI